MFTADQLVAHAVGDYILQSHWMALNKSDRDTWRGLSACTVHCLLYTLPFALITDSWLALYTIFATHWVIDHYGLAKYVVWLKNGPFEGITVGRIGVKGLEWRKRFKLKPMTPTGYPAVVPVWLSTPLTMIADNILHVICNGLAIYYL